MLFTLKDHLFPFAGGVFLPATTGGILFTIYKGTGKKVLYDAPAGPLLYRREHRPDGPADMPFLPVPIPASEALSARL